MTRRISVALWIIVVVVAQALAGCTTPVSGSQGGTAAVLARLRPLAATCQGPRATYIAWDLSASSRNDPAIDSEREQIVTDAAAQVAACTGVIEVVGFAHSITDTVTLAHAEFPTSSGTETARLLAANKSLVTLTAALKTELPAATQRLAATGTDIVGTLLLAQQFASEHEGEQLTVLLLTDGIQSGVHLASLTLTKAKQAADHVSNVPSLPGATVRIAGVGHVRGPGSAQPASAITLAVTAFWQRLCARTQAASCLVTND